MGPNVIVNQTTYRTCEIIKNAYEVKLMKNIAIFD